MLLKPWLWGLALDMAPSFLKSVSVRRYSSLALPCSSSSPCSGLLAVEVVRQNSSRADRPGLGWASFCSPAQGLLQLRSTARRKLEAVHGLQK